jgi:hypothetical protein
MYAEHQKYVEDIISGVFPGCIIRWRSANDEWRTDRIHILFNGCETIRAWLPFQYDLADDKKLFAMDIAEEVCVNLVYALLCRLEKEIEII